MREFTCDEVHEAAAQFALDILTPEDRDQVDAHLRRCPRCRQDVAGMQASAAELLDLEAGPPYEQWGPYPADFEAAPVRPGRRRLRMAVTMAAAAVLMVGTTLGPEIEQAARPQVTPAATAQLVQAGRPVGKVYFYRNRQPAVELEVRGLAATGQVTCAVISQEGALIRAGQFKLFEGHGYWAGPNPIDPGRMSSVVLLDGRGQVLASASL